MLQFTNISSFSYHIVSFIYFSENQESCSVHFKLWPGALRQSQFRAIRETDKLHYLTNLRNMVTLIQSNTMKYNKCHHLECLLLYQRQVKTPKHQMLHIIKGRNKQKSRKLVAPLKKLSTFQQVLTLKIFCHYLTTMFKNIRTVTS